MVVGTALCLALWLRASIEMITILVQLGEIVYALDACLIPLASSRIKWQFCFDFIPVYKGRINQMMSVYHDYNYLSLFQDLM